MTKVPKSSLLCIELPNSSFMQPSRVRTHLTMFVNDGPKLTDLKRRLTVKKVSKRVVELRGEEQQLHQQLAPEVEVVLKGKKPPGVEGADGTNVFR